MSVENRKIIVYPNVFDRKNAVEMNLEQFLETPEDLFESTSKYYDFEEVLNEIKNTEDKGVRNDLKRNRLPAVDLSQTGVLSIDIDNISHLEETKRRIIYKLKTVNTCMAVQESVSGNLVAYFKYDCTVSEFPFLYYKIYLELVLMLSVNIDFLPEIGRLRYVSGGEVYHLNYESETLFEILDVDQLPYINTAVKKDDARCDRYGSN